jgi:hypothetical protein
MRITTHNGRRLATPEIPMKATAMFAVPQILSSPHPTLHILPTPTRIVPRLHNVEIVEGNMKMTTIT